MGTARLSSKGQLIIPKPVRKAHCWETGQELEVVDMEDGVLLKTKSPFRQTSLNEVAGSLSYSGPAKTVAQMKEAIGKGIKTRHS